VRGLDINWAISGPHPFIPFPLFSFFPFPPLPARHMTKAGGLFDVTGSMSESDTAFASPSFSFFPFFPPSSAAAFAHGFGLLPFLFLGPCDNTRRAAWTTSASSPSLFLLPSVQTVQRLPCVPALRPRSATPAFSIFPSFFPPGVLSTVKKRISFFLRAVQSGSDLFIRPPRGPDRSRGIEYTPLSSSLFFFPPLVLRASNSLSNVGAQIWPLRI